MGQLVTADDFKNYNSGTGVFPLQRVEDAIMLAEGQVEEWLNTAVVPTARTEEQPWPIDNGRIQLEKTRIISITGVLALHDQGCDCEWQEVVACARIEDADRGIITVKSCTGGGSACWPCRCPRKVRITYSYGFTAAQSLKTTHDGMTLQAGIFQAALGYLQTGIGLNASGNVAIGSFSSAGYSESRQFNERSGTNENVNPQMQLAQQTVRRLRIFRPPANMRKQGTWL